MTSQITIRKMTLSCISKFCGQKLINYVTIKNSFTKKIAHGNSAMQHRNGWLAALMRRWKTQKSFCDFHQHESQVQLLMTPVWTRTRTTAGEAGKQSLESPPPFLNFLQVRSSGKSQGRSGERLHQGGLGERAGGV